MRYITLLFMLTMVLVGTIAHGADKTDNLLIQGKNFAISVKEPKGWKGDSTDTAISYTNFVFYRTSEKIQNAKTLIRILVTNKTDEKTAEDLKYDMEGYRKQYPDIRFKDITVKHPEYPTFAKLLYLEKGFHEYVTYLNPGKNYPYLISISMTIQNTEAGKEDMQAYSFIVGSLKAMK